MNDYLSKDDYEEPMCLLNMHPEINPIPIDRIIKKLDSFLDRDNYSEAEHHLSYWISEADSNNDMNGKLTVLNEQIGLYRKTGKKAECLHAVEETLNLANSSGIDGSVTCGTTLINAATGYKAFGKANEALPLYRKAKSIYEALLNTNDGKFGGLYNNMALTLTELGMYEEAKKTYQKAINVMEKQKNGELEVAITYLNLADLVAAESGLEAGEAEITNYLSKAEELLNTESLPRNPYYAFVCEKCAPVFGYYGYFLTERELNRRAGEIYDRA